MRFIRSDSERISSLVGDSVIVAIEMNDRTLIPRISGSRKLSAVAPPEPPMTMPAGPAAGYIRIAAIPM
jgi:uncharacterized protein (UPF0254 family)